MHKNREIISGLPADQVHDRVLIADPDGDGSFPQLDGVAVDRVDMAKSDDKGLVHADELPGWQGLFEVVHGLMGDQRVVGRMDLEVIAATLDVEDLGAM